MDPRRSPESRIDHRQQVATGLVLAALILPLLLEPAAGTSARTPAATPRALRPTSTRGTPGWYPSVDPESMSVLLGRRSNAPVVKARFSGGARNMEEMGRMVCRMLHHDAADSLLALCVTESEFRDILWREFPSSRPATGLTWEDGWRTLSVRLLSGTRDATADYGDRSYEFVRWERMARGRDTLTVYKNFRLHNGLLLVARRDDGTLERMHWLRSVAERGGRFKIFSTND